MIRRLASFSRDDQVSSARDYQTVLQRTSDRLDCSSNEDSSVKVDISLSHIQGGISGFGLYFRSNSSGSLDISLSNQAGELASTTCQTNEYWSKAGFAIETLRPESLTVLINISSGISNLDIWGSVLAPLVLPGILLESESILEDLCKISLSPETLYLDHEGAGSYFVSIAEFENCTLHQGEGDKINVKKCAYCQRYLPIDPRRPGALAFHRHKAKRTGHQNECRACKKWRINDNLNPRRSADQLHESSITTREKKIFLEEPLILQQIKNRYGAGLRSIIWEKFNKRCFKCKQQVELTEFQLDHTRPLAYLWPIDIHATCLCPNCNNHKGDRFPADFYSASELEELSLVCGLPLADLSAKSINIEQLNKILEDPRRYALSWEASTFQSISRKVNEIMPAIDLYTVLDQADHDVYVELQQRMSERPVSFSADINKAPS